MTKELRKKLQYFEQDHQATVLYVTKYGSKLYGTDNINSDTDYKGVFVQNKDLVLLKKDIDHWTSNSSNANEKNGANDVDLQLFSVHKLFQLLKKGETGALDLLFSMWATDTVVFENTVFTDHMKLYYEKFLNRKLHSFTGYAVGQAKKYGIKGTRYKELTKFKEWLNAWARSLKEHSVKNGNLEKVKLSVLFDGLKLYFSENEPKYLYMTTAEGPKTGKGENIIDYVEILGKKFSGDVTVKYFVDKVNAMGDEFGNRAKSSAEGVDWKALSHSVRVLFEVEELLDTGFISFPLKEKEFVKEVKEGKVLVDAVMFFVNKKLDQVKEKLENSNLPEKADDETMDWLELFFLENFSPKSMEED